MLTGTEVTVHGPGRQPAAAIAFADALAQWSQMPLVGQPLPFAITNSVASGYAGQPTGLTLPSFAVQTQRF